MNLLKDEVYKKAVNQVDKLNYSDLIMFVNRSRLMLVYLSFKEAEFSSEINKANDLDTKLTATKKYNDNKALKKRYRNLISMVDEKCK